MSTRTFYPNNTADIEIPYNVPATTAFEREITWIRPDTDSWTMTAITLSFTTPNAGYAVTVRHTGGDGIAGYSSTTAGTGVHTFDLPQEAWEELDTDSVTVSVKRPTGNRQTYRDLHIIVTYEARGGDDPQPVSPTPKHVPATRDHSRVRPVISVMSQWEQDFPNSMDALRVGEGILTPTDCVITEEAGGAYQLSLTHPIDPAGKWKLLTPFCLIVAPIPRTSTPFIDQSSNTIISAGMDTL